MMKIAEEQAGDVTIIAVNGQVDSNTAKPFEEKLTSLFTSGRNRVIVDFKHLAYITSAGFRALLVVGKNEATGRTVSVRRLGQDKQEVMPLDVALKALADEAIPPDVRRAKN